MFRYKYLCNKVLFFLCCILFCCSSLNARCTEDVVKGVVVQNEHVGYGEVQRVHHGGKAIGSVVESGGKQVIYCKGRVENTVVSKDGCQLLFVGGISKDVVVMSGGSQVLFGGVSYETLLKNGGLQVLYGGTSFKTSVVENKALQVVCGGVSKRTILGNGGEQLVFYGGKVENTVVGKDGCQMLSGSMVYKTYVDGGKQLICRNNIVKDTVIVNGGVQSLIDDDDIGIFCVFNVISHSLVKDISRNNYLVNVLVKDKGRVLVPQSYVSHGINFKNLKIDAGGNFEECDK